MIRKSRKGFTLLMSNTNSRGGLQLFGAKRDNRPPADLDPLGAP